jgi:2,3-diaminopropionate biosynthesis protein SbnB
MLYLNENDLNNMGIAWSETIGVIEETVKCLAGDDFAQPIKPYLRYGNLKNRIIAMPAYLGGDFNIAGIKWIASFPDNIRNNIPRAHSVVVLNEADTGRPVSIINTPLLSIIRTASVSGLILRYYDKERDLENFNLGIVGWGPIGQNHLRMCSQVFGKKLSKVFLYDINPIRKEKIDFFPAEKIQITGSWQEAYLNADVFITCTTAKEPYIDEKPKKGSILLNVSLRDFKAGIYKYVKNSIIVDDWDEVCRENTDIERFHRENGLEKSGVSTILDVVCGDLIKSYGNDRVLMFNPMGMAVFDIAIAKHYLEKARQENTGLELD